MRERRESAAIAIMRATMRAILRRAFARRARYYYDDASASVMRACCAGMSVDAHTPAERPRLPFYYLPRVFAAAAAFTRCRDAQRHDAFALMMLLLRAMRRSSYYIFTDCRFHCRYAFTPLC